MTCIEFAAERSWTTPSPSAATEAAAHDRAPTFPHGWRLRDRALLVFALSSPFHFSHPYSPPYVERARANSSGKERAKERAKTEIGDTESHPEIRKSCLLPVHFGWSRLGDLNPGPTHYEPFAAPLGSRSYSCMLRLTPASSAIHAPCSGAYPGHFAAVDATWFIANAPTSLRDRWDRDGERGSLAKAGAVCGDGSAVGPYQRPGDGQSDAATG